MKYRIVIAVALVALAWSLQPSKDVKPPVPDGPLDLTACFEGGDAAQDAAIVAAMASEIADVIEWDGMQEQPLLDTGFALDQMRTKTREFMCRGESLGEKHPLLCERVSEYLTDELGNDGGVVSDQQRAAWVSCYREIARAARATIQ